MPSNNHNIKKQTHQIFFISFSLFHPQYTRETSKCIKGHQNLPLSQSLEKLIKENNLLNIKICQIIKYFLDPLR